jgi:Holliday junction resolvase RusA-like endonuclease
VIYLATFEFTVPGPCIGKQRPRFRRVKNFVTTYTPKETKEYEKKVIKSFNKVAKGKQLEGAVKAEICMIFEPPKSVSKQKREEMITGRLPYIKKIDADNGIKSILDGLNNVAYEDDAIVNEVHAYKMYGPVSCTQVRLTDDKHVIKPFWFVKGES